MHRCTQLVCLVLGAAILAACGGRPTGSVTAPIGTAATIPAAPAPSTAGSASAPVTANTAALTSALAAASSPVSSAAAPTPRLAQTAPAATSDTQATTQSNATSLTIRTLDDGSLRVHDPVAGTTLLFPPGWEPLDPQDPAVQEQLNQGARSTELNRALNGNTASAVKTLAIYTETPEEFLGQVNMNLVELPQRLPLSAEAIAAPLKDQLETRGVSDVEQRVTALPAGEAVELQYTAPAQQNAPDLTALQYFVLGAKQTYILTFGAPSDLFSDYQGDFESIAQSFDIDGE